MTFKAAQLVEFLNGIYVSSIDEQLVNLFGKNVVFLDENVHCLFEKLDEASFIVNFVCSFSYKSDSLKDSWGQFFEPFLVGQIIGNFRDQFFYKPPAELLGVSGSRNLYV